MYHSAVQLEYEITLPEFMEMAWRRRRSSISWVVGVVAGALGFLLGAVLYVCAPADPWPLLLAGY